MAKIVPVPQFDYVVFGATGDLTMRKLLPSLYHRFRDRQFDDRCRIVAAARTEISDDGYRARAEEGLRQFVKADFDAATVQDFLRLVVYNRVDGAGEEGWPS